PEWSYEIFLTHVHPDDRALVNEKFQQTISAHTAWNFECRIIHPDQSVHWIWVRSSVYCDQNDTPTRLLGMVVDITERKQAEAALWESEKQSRNILESITEAFFALDENWQFTYVNQAAEKLLDRSPRDLIGKDFWEEFPGLAGTNFAQLHLRVMRDRIAESLTAFYPDHDRWYDVRSFPATNGITIYFRDVTAQIQIESALRESEERTRNVLESIAEAFFALDQDWRFAYMNQSGGVLLDRPPDDLIGKNFWEEYPGVMGSEFERIYRGAMEDRVAGSLTAFYPDHERWYEVRTYPAANGIAVYFNNVTAQRQAEEASRLSEDRFRRIFESKMIGIGLWSRSGEITDANDALLEMIGYTQQDLNDGRLRWREITVPEHAERDEQALAEIAISGTCSSYEKDFIHKQGHRVPILVRAAVFADASDAGVFFAVDLSDRKQIEAALKAGNERLNLLSEIANDLLLNEDPKASLDRLFAKVSTHLKLEVFFNYLFEADQQHLRLHAHGGISEEIAQSASILELGQGVCGYAVQHRRPVVVENALESDHPLALPVGSIGIRAYASHPLIVGDRVLGTLGMGTCQRDRFTPDELDLMQVVAHQVAAALERSRLVTELQMRAEALAQTNRIKDEFLAVLSHELRSPLNPILGWTQLLQTGKLDAARQADALATIERNAKLQSQLIEDLLDISRIMQGKLSLNPTPTSLVSVISAAVETVQLATEAKHIAIALDLDSQSAPIFGDAGRLQQVVWNLLTNAVKFTPKGGQVTVELRQVDQLAQIRVIDTGIGINAQFLPYVFEYFRQEDGSTTRKFGGLGLGLAIVRQIVELHGGTVAAESDGEHQGATFIVQLPTMQQATPIRSESTRAQLNSETPLNNVQILLVDDDTDTREFQAFLLEQYGATVTAVASGLEALQALEQFIPDVIVSDIGMAEMDGHSLMQQIRSRSPAQGGAVPAIALTAYAAEIDQEKAFQAGFQIHLTKPLEPERFVSEIITLLKPSRV
ncbi:PAS domain S-box protein, partial [Phormidium sp. FACHB-322]